MHVPQDEVDGAAANEHQEPGLAQDFKGNGENTRFWGCGDFFVARLFYPCRRFFFGKGAMITKMQFFHHLYASISAYLMHLTNKFIYAMLEFS